MPTTQVETENKYELADDREVPSFDELPEVASTAGPATHELEATYFDSRDLAVTAAGITLRRRTGGHDAGWHVKLPTEGGRFEVHEPLGRATRTVPKALREILQTITRGSVLEPIVVVRTHRTVHNLLDADGGVLAEVSDDRVTAWDLSGGETAPRAWRELEVELVNGGDSLLEGAARLLGAQGIEPSSSGSKLRRALRDRVPAAASRDTGREDTATGIVHARLADLVATVRALDPLVRADAPDAVHQMRVTTRRLRNALATFRPLLDRELTEPLRDELRWFAGVLGEARDAEVLRKRLLREIDEEPPEMVRGGAREFIDEDLTARYQEAHRRSLQSMRTDRYLDLVDRLEQMAIAPPWVEAAPDRGVDFLQQRVRHDFKRLRRRVESSEHAHDEADHSRRLHEVRKAAKRVRYAVEPLVPMHGKQADKLAKAMKKIQSVLGDHQDGAVTRLALRHLSDRAAAEGVNAYSLGILDIRQEQLAADRRSQFVSTWERASRKKLRRWLS